MAQLPLEKTGPYAYMVVVIIIVQSLNVVIIVVYRRPTTISVNAIRTED